MNDFRRAMAVASMAQAHFAAFDPDRLQLVLGVSEVGGNKSIKVIRIDDEIARAMSLELVNEWEARVVSRVLIAARPVSPRARARLSTNRKQERCQVRRAMLTLDAIAARFPEYAIEVSRAGDTGTPPLRWRARWYRHSGGGLRDHEGDTQGVGDGSVTATQLKPHDLHVAMLRGMGTSLADPGRTVHQYWSKEGRLLAEYDSVAAPEGVTGP